MGFFRIKFFAPIRWHVKTLFNRLRIRRTPRQNSAPTTGGAESASSVADQQLVARVAGGHGFSWRRLRHINKLLNPTERLRVRIILGLALASVAFVGFRYLARHLVAVPRAQGSFTEGVVGAPQLINPLLSQANDVDADMASLIFSGLFRYDENLTAIPDLTEKYTVNPAGTAYVVTIKPNLRWHDGQPLTADDVVFTYQTAQDPAFGSPLRISLAGVLVAKTGEREVTFQMSEPNDRFLDLLTTGLLPEHLWREVPPIHSKLTEYNLNNPVGSGRWRFKSLTKDRHGNIKSYTLTRFPDAPAPPPFLQEIVFKFYQTPRDTVEALNNRSVDGIIYLPRESDAALSDPRIKRYALSLPQYTAIFFNQQTAAALREKKVRQALAAAIDRGKILTDALKLEGEMVEGPILPGQPGYDPELKAPTFDPSAAEQLLDAAGWARLDAATYARMTLESASTTPINTDAPATSTANTEMPPAATSTLPAATTDREQKYYRKNAAGDILELQLTTVDVASNVATAKLIADFWQEVGVKVNVDIAPPSQVIREVIKPRSYQILLYGEAIGADPDPYPFWHSSQTADPGLNLAGYANRNVDKLLEEARGTIDLGVRTAKYQEFARLLNAELPAIFLYAPSYTYALHAKVKGFGMSNIMLPQDRFNQINAWYVRTRWVWR